MEVSSADNDGGAVWHLFSSRMSNNCGILHVSFAFTSRWQNSVSVQSLPDLFCALWQYCMNSEVIHLTAANASGPYTFADTALAPRMDNWDNGAVHGATGLPAFHSRWGANAAIFSRFLTATGSSRASRSMCTMQGYLFIAYRTALLLYFTWVRCTEASVSLV